MTESQEQKELIKWFRYTWPEHDKALRLSANGCNFGTGKKAFMMINSLKAQGLTVGESDLAILIPRHTFHGLILEFKSTKGKHKLTQAQDEYLQYMSKQGYMSVCCKGLDSAKETIQSYMLLTSRS